MASHADIAPLRLRVARRADHDVRRTTAWREDLRSVGALVGIALTAGGVAVVAASALVDLVLALPLHHVVRRPPLWLGLATAVVGALVARACRTRPVRRVRRCASAGAPHAPRAGTGGAPVRN